MNSESRNRVTYDQALVYLVRKSLDWASEDRTILDFLQRVFHDLITVQDSETAESFAFKETQFFSNNAILLSQMDDKHAIALKI